MFEPGMAGEVKALETAVAGFCAAFDPDSIPLPEVAQTHRSLVYVHRLVTGALTRIAPRVEESGEWRRHGDSSPEDYWARTNGVSKNQAKTQMDTAKRLSDLPATEQALRDGELSAEQAAAVADGAAADPVSERRLLGKAKTASLPDLREEAKRVKAGADPDAAATRARIHRERSLKRWTDSEGAYHLHLRTTADIGAHLDAALKPVTDRLFHDARKAGRHEPVEAYAADALVELVTRSPAEGKPSKGRECKVVALIDYDALKRGHVEAGETSEIAGVGPVPVETVRSMLTDAFLALVVTDGVDVYTVAHAGHQVTAYQRTALEARGYRCEVPGCTVRHNLEIDHVTGYAVTKRTQLDDLAWLCPHDHDLKTYEGWTLTGPPGHRQWIAPDGNIQRADPGPDPPAKPQLFESPDAAAYPRTA